VEAGPCLRWSSAIARRRQSLPRQMDLPPLSHQALFTAVQSADVAVVRALLADAEASGTTTAESPRRRTQGRRPCTSRQSPAPRTSCACSSPYTTSRARSRLDLHAFHVAAKQGLREERRGSGRGFRAAAAAVKRGEAMRLVWEEDRVSGTAFRSRRNGYLVNRRQNKLHAGLDQN
jgi:hypothetical protein